MGDEEKTEPVVEEATEPSADAEPEVKEPESEADGDEAEG